MKNLIGAIAPTNRVLGSFKMLMLIIMVAIGFTSCKDQSKSEVSPKTELIGKTDFEKLESNLEIGGNQTGGRRLCHFEKSFDIGGGTGGQERRNFDIGGAGVGQVPLRRICNVYSKAEIGGGKNSTGGLQIASDIGGKGTSTSTGQISSYNQFDIGGKGGRGTSSGGEYYSSEIGGKSTSTTGNYALNVIEGKRDMKVIRRILEPFTADIGGRGTSGTGF